MITKFTIYGERCSGTNYLENLIVSNFDVEITWKYGWKHFFGFDNVNNSDDTLFICIVRDPCDWINSLFKTPHHLSKQQCSSIHNFLYDQITSYTDIDETDEIIRDRNMYNNEKYKNIMELRSFKLKYLIEDLPLNVRNYTLIQYESLLNDFENTMIKIKDCGLKIKSGINFPKNIETDVKHKREVFKTIIKNNISKEEIINHPYFNTFYERKIGYIY